MDAKVVPMLDNLMLTHSARYGVAVSAAKLAEQFGLMTERASDSLDYFDFFGIELEGVRFGFRTYFRSPAREPHALVAVVPREAANAVELIARITRLQRDQIETYDRDW